MDTKNNNNNNNNDDNMMDYQDAIMLAEEARLIIRKIQQDEDDNGDGNFTTTDEADDETQRKAYIRIAHSLYLRALNIQEAIFGWCHEDTARLYYELGWLEYDLTTKFECALAYLLRSLRISHQIHGDRHPATIVILDDVQDLLEDMNLDINEYVNRVFRSWELQNEAEDIWEDKEREMRDDQGYANTHQTDHQSSSPVLELFHEALDELPLELELERALIFRQMASYAASRQRFGQDALSYYCSALMRLPNWVSPDHPEIRAIRREAQRVTREQLTPISGRIPNTAASRQQSVVVVSSSEQEEDRRDPVSFSWKRRRSQHSNHSWRTSYSTSATRIASE